MLAAGIGAYAGTANLADSALFVAVIIGFRNVRIKPALAWILVLAGPAFLSAAWSVEPAETLLLAARVAGIVVIANSKTWHVPARHSLWLLAAMAVAAVSLYGSPGGAGLSQNAVTMGELGLVGVLTGNLAAMVGSIPLLSSTGTRGPIGAAIIFALAARRRKVFLVVAVAMAWWWIYASAGDITYRITDADFVMASLVDRANSQIVTDDTPAVATEQTDALAVDGAERPRVHWFGYGVGSFNERTGRQRPHSVPATLIYELGILAVVPLVGLAVLLATKLPWPHALALAALYGTLTETPAGAAIGAYTILLLVLFSKEKHFGMAYQSAWTVFETAIWNRLFPCRARFSPPGRGLFLSWRRR